MRAVLELTSEVSIGLRRLATELNMLPAEAAAFALRDWLTAHGYTELERELDEDTETVGEA